MRVEVDAEQCEGNGICEGIAPEVFHLGDRDEVVEVTQHNVPPDLQHVVQQAVDQCPKAALRIAE